MSTTASTSTASASTTTTTDVDANITKIVDNVISAYTEFTLKDFFECIVKLMECAEAIPLLAGADKKKVVKGVLTQLITKLNIPDQGEKDVILFLINSSIVDLMIDGIVKLTKEGCKINVQQIIEKCGCKCCGGKCAIM